MPRVSGALWGNSVAQGCVPPQARHGSVAPSIGRQPKQHGLTRYLSTSTCGGHGAVDAIATILIEAGGADPLLADTRGELPIHLAAMQGHTDLLDMLLLKAPTPLNRNSSEGNTPSCLAAMSGRECVVLHLLRLGAEQPNESSNSPLAAAVEFDHGEVLRILLDNGMDAVGSIRSVASAMESAVRKGRAKSLAALLGHFDGDEGTRQNLLDGVQVVFRCCTLSPCHTAGGSRRDGR